MRPRFLSVRPLVVLVLTWIIALPAFADAQTPKRGGTLRVSYGNEIAHLDFHTAPGYEMMWVAMNVGCGLVNITPDGKFDTTFDDDGAQLDRVGRERHRDGDAIRIGGWRDTNRRGLVAEAANA